MCKSTYFPMLILEIYIYFWRMKLNDLQLYACLPQCLEFCNSRTDGPNYLSKMQQTSQKRIQNGLLWARWKFFLFSAWQTYWVSGILIRYVLWVMYEQIAEKCLNLRRIHCCTSFLLQCLIGKTEHSFYQLMFELAALIHI